MTDEPELRLARYTGMRFHAFTIAAVTLALLTTGWIIKYFEFGANEERYWFTAFPDEVSTQWWGEKKKFNEQSAKQIPIRPDLILEVLGVNEINEDVLEPPVPTMRV